MNPIELFKIGYEQECKETKVQIPSACCLTSIGLDGYPNSRFVSLKEILDDQFIITGSLQSRKGLEIQQNPKVSLAFWWTSTEKQIRIQGNATRIENELADQYFKERNKASQIISLISNQGDTIQSIEELQKVYKSKSLELKAEIIDRPENWGGFKINPVRIEFMDFEESRFHKRTLYTKSGSIWKITYLQP